MSNKINPILNILLLKIFFYYTQLEIYPKNITYFKAPQICLIMQGAQIAQYPTNHSWKK